MEADRCECQDPVVMWLGALLVLRWGVGLCEGEDEGEVWVRVMVRVGVRVGVRVEWSKGWN